MQLVFEQPVEIERLCLILMIITLQVEWNLTLSRQIRIVPVPQPYSRYVRTIAPLDTIYLSTIHILSLDVLLDARVKKKQL
jgi:hypothetical protein